MIALFVEHMGFPTALNETVRKAISTFSTRIITANIFGETRREGKCLFNTVVLV